MYLGGLGVSFADLPRQGVNLRLYSYDPPGTQFYNPGGYIYNTGHYDASLPGGACSASDPQGFNDPASMNAYAGSRGEMLVLVSRSDLTALCAYRPPAQVSAPAQVYAPPPIVSGTPGGGPVGTGITLQPLITSTGSVAQPPTGAPTFVQGPGPSGSIDTGQTSEAAAFQDWLTTHPGGTFADYAASLTKGHDNEGLIYVGLAVLGIALLGGRARRGGGA